MRQKTLYLSLQVPAAIHLDESDWNLTKRCEIAGVNVEGGDSPWVGMADLLIDSTTRKFVGLTYQIVDRGEQEQANRIAQRLNPEVVHFDDLSTKVSQQRYAGEAREAQRFEISWAPARDLRFELAQLFCGQFFWWYALEGDWGIPMYGVATKPIVAIGVSGVDDILSDHNLTFPDVSHLPPLTVEWF